MQEITNWSQTKLSDLIAPGVQKTHRLKGSVPFPWKGQLVFVNYDIEVIKTFCIGNMSFEFPKAMGPINSDGTLPGDVTEANEEIIHLLAEDIWKSVLSAEEETDTPKK